MLTQLDNDISIFNSMSNGANGYMLKSSSLNEIIKSIRDVLSGISPMNPFIATRVLEMFQNISKPKQDYSLTNQEKNVLNEIVEGLSKKMIADKLFISFHTVDSHIRNIYSKLNVNTQVSLVTKALREQII
jgi:DNA-binding NarL/FixJ family response regulator